VTPLPCRTPNEIGQTTKSSPIDSPVKTRRVYCYWYVLRILIFENYTRVCTTRFSFFLTVLSQVDVVDGQAHSSKKEGKNACDD
jgi:hypothetical protein